MIQLNDLSDDCLLEVLDRLSPGQLFKVQRLNKRMKLLAEVKMRIKIKAINSTKGNELVSHCHDHLGSSSSDQFLFVGNKFNHYSLQFKLPRTLFLNLLTKFPGIKSLEIDVNCTLPSDFLFEVVRRCPELECFKLVDAMVKEEDWSKLLDQIGHKLVHFEVKHGFKEHYVPIYQKLLAMVAEKCSNIKRVDWFVIWSLSKGVVEAFKMLPKNCWVTLECYIPLREYIFEDVIDELKLSRLDWSMFGNRNTRLSTLRFWEFTFDEGNEEDDDDDAPVQGVELANLKYLEFHGVLRHPEFVTSLVSSRFPCLEEFNFNANGNLKEADYDRLFQNMTSLKKLTIQYKVHFPTKALFPQSAIRRLIKLETIIFYVEYIPSSWKPALFFKKIPRYVDWISSLKKLTVRVEETHQIRNKKTLADGVKRMQQAEAKKQKEKRVEIDLIIKKRFEL